MPGSLAHNWLARLLLVALISAPSSRTASAQSADEFGRIIGGDKAKAGAFPAMVAVLFDGQLMCGGTLIGSNWVLTAGHCAKNATGVVRKPSNLAVFMGSAKLGAGGRRIAVKQVIPHPDYAPRTMANDIALLELAQPATEPRQLLASSGVLGQLTRPGTPASVTGWGRTKQGGDTSVNLLQVSLPIVTRESCAEAYSASKSGKVTENNICAGLDTGGKDSCQGDSGGPLYVGMPTSGPVQVGIVSWGEGCARPKKYGVYTSVAAFEPFLRAHVPDVSFATPDVAPGGAGPAEAVAAAQPSTLLPPGLTGQVSLDVVPTGPVKLGTSITLTIRSTEPGTLLVFSRDSAGKIVKLVPNKFLLDDAQQIKPDVPVQIPRPGDRFTITAKQPTGETTLIAIVAPRGAKIADLASAYMGLETITDPAAFFAALASRLTEARMAEPPVAMPRGFEVVETGGPPIPVAMRKVMLTE